MQMLPRVRDEADGDGMKGLGIADGAPRRPCTAVITLRVPEGVAAAMDRQARAEGLTGASLARRCLAERFTADAQDTQPVRRYRPMRPAPSPDRLAVAQLREAVGEAVGTLRQVAGLDRTRGGARLAELDAAIDRLLAQVPRLDALKDSLP